jgi:zinc protease
MKKPTFIAYLLSITIPLQAQILDVETYELDNGLKVFLNEDRAASNVYGAVWINAGGKNDPSDATGIAHYLEHMLFKGTVDLGTIDYGMEKPHLDSIKLLYDQLALTTDKGSRASIQLSINEQELKASAYAIPNEFDRLIKSIGSTGVNASTSYDYTNYYNYFPPNQIYRWLDIYAHRFQQPVFRLFQSELEAVYEEKNRAADDLERRVSSRFGDYIYGDHPYSTQKVLGSIEHLKNPSLSKMYQFFNDYYVANNMALVLCGNFVAEDVKPYIEQTFGQLKRGEVPQSPDIAPNQFEGREVEKLRITPIKAGFMGYKLVPETHPDRAALEIIGYMMSNENQTGFLDEMTLNNELIYAGGYQEFLKEDGSTFIFFVPKVFGKRLKKFEDEIRNDFMKIAGGDFTEPQLNAVKNSIYKSFNRSLESLGNRGWFIGNSFILGTSWDEFVSYPEKVLNTSKSDLTKAAMKYYGDNYFVMQSRTGFPKKPKIKKPPYKPIAVRTDSVSSYAKYFEGLPENEINTQFIDFEKDVKIVEDYIYYSENPINDVFTLDLKIAGGIEKDRLYPVLAAALNVSGTSQYTAAALKKEFAEIGASYEFTADYASFDLSITGLDRNFEATTKLLKHLLQEFTPADQTIDYLYNQRVTENKRDKNNPSSGGRMLYLYGLFGEKSYYKRRLPAKELKQMPPDQLMGKLEKLVAGGFSSIHYTGTLSLDAVRDIFVNEPLFQRNTTDQFTFMEADTPKSTTIYLVNDKKAIQSHVYYIVNGEKMNFDDYFRKEAFNNYYTNSLSGLLFQEVREFRSLAYATGGRYIDPVYDPRKAGRLVLFTGSQSDKTQDAVEVVLGLINDMPIYESRLEGIKRGLILQSSSSKPSFRDISSEVERYQKTGFTEDPNKMAYRKYDNLTFSNIQSFYKENIQGKPVAVTIYGDASSMNLDELRQLGEVVELKMSDVVVK